MVQSVRPRIVVVGAGFGGLAVVRQLRGVDCDVIVVDRRNYHLFQPLLYQVATAALSPTDIAWPIRGLTSSQENVQVVMGRVVGVDTTERAARLEGGASIAFDHLVLATGARHSYFGRDDWEGDAPGLKKIADALRIRERVLTAFERAEVTDDPVERARLLSFVVIGGGPTGVEMAGAIAELAKSALGRDFHRIRATDARVLLVEGGPRLLASFPEALSLSARRQLEALGVEVRVGTRVTSVDRSGVAWAEGNVAARTVIWAAGVTASPAAKWLGVPADRVGRIVVGPDLAVPGHPCIWAIGDTVALTDAAGRAVPGVAPAAKQMGAHVGRSIAARLAGVPTPAPFRYRDWGNLATIGRHSAVADFGRIRLAGPTAWVLWAVAHVWFLIGWRSRLLVAMNWSWSYVTYRRGARLITAPAWETEPAAVPAVANVGATVP